MLATTHGGALAAHRQFHSDSAFAQPSRVSGKIASFLDQYRFERPTLVLDIDQVARSYGALSRGLEGAHIHYAVKANPQPEVIARLVALGSRFDAASRVEIALCLAQGARPEHISFGNTVKRPSDIAWAHEAGIDLFSADAEEELTKIATYAPGARVYIRVLVEHSEADWPLSRKFGTSPEETLRLIGHAWSLGLRPVGLSFHVGSQTREAAMWSPILDMVAGIWREARAAGFPLELLNIGGGFPAFYGEAVQEAEDYGREIMAEIRARFGDEPAYIMAEPGRGMVAEAGVIAAEILLVSRKRPTDIARWVYLDIGRFSGLAETEGEAIRYQIETEADGGETGPCVLAGPSCDSADVLYEKRPVQLPLALKAGDRVRILACGAYTTTYASIGFNGFPPLDVICI
ncbi:MAG TPA: type III PLP-dependent enzyme [Thermohalobaculum sp.]|nr:type III PLP-dependent enzyme [Thermohalobaculum sp.]